MFDGTTANTARRQLIYGDLGFRESWLGELCRCPFIDSSHFDDTERLLGNEELHERQLLMIPRHPNMEEILQCVKVPGLPGTDLPSFSGLAGKLRGAQLQRLREDIRAYAHMISDFCRTNNADSSSYSSSDDEDPEQVIQGPSKRHRHEFCESEQ